MTTQQHLNPRYTSNTPTWNDRLQWLADVAEGMKYLHSIMHCCHRDLKSPNILLSGKPGGATHAKIADFGMSKIVVSDAQTKEYTKKHSFKGRKSRYGGKSFGAEASSITLKNASMLQGGFWTSRVGTLEWLAPELMKANKDRVKLKSHYTDTVDQYVVVRTYLF